MKKDVRLKALVAFAVVMSACLSLHAGDMVASANGRLWTYAENNDGSLMITGVKLNTQCPVTIPSSLDGRPVSRIKEDAFRDNTMITGVTIPGCIVSIGDRAFAGCANLEVLTILEGVRAIGGSDAFRWCPALKTVTIPKTLTFIRQRAFRDGSDIERVNVDSVKSYLSIGYGTGSSPPLYRGKGCLYTNGVRIVDVVIPDAVEQINSWAFASCDSMKSITIPGSVKRIRGEAIRARDNSPIHIIFRDDIGTLEVAKAAFDKGITNIEVLPKDGTPFSCWVDKDGNQVEDPFHSPMPVVVTPKWGIAEHGNDFPSRDSVRTSTNERAPDKKPIPSTKQDDTMHNGNAIKKIVQTSRNLFEQVKDKIVIVQCDDSTGSGFVCELDGKRYFVTNRHVIEGQTIVVAKFSDGKKLRFGKMEIAQDDVDLVRFQVATNQPALRLSSATMRQTIVVFGNSDGSGALTDLKGEVVGIGPDKIEITAKIVHGNSGSAVLDEDGNVLGVASLATLDNDPKDWVKKDTRFANIRRWALTLENVRWKEMDLKTLCKIAKAKKEDRQKSHGIYPQTRASFKAPSLRINKWQTNWDPVYWINGNIVLGLSNTRSIKNPVVRVVMLVDFGNEKVVMDSIAARPGGNYKYSNVPVYSYGMQSSGRTYEVGDSYVYYLEAISYYQGATTLFKAKDLEYFDRGKLLRGGFRLPDNKIAPRVLPKLVAYRLECWQNGSLAGVYDSTGPSTLDSKGIPVDWFILGRYPRLFSYCETRYEKGYRH